MAGAVKNCPFVGYQKATRNGTLGGGTFVTLMFTIDEVAMMPLLSVATAVKAYFPANTLLQARKKGLPCDVLVSNTVLVFVTLPILIPFAKYCIV